MHARKPGDAESEGDNARPGAAEPDAARDLSAPTANSPGETAKLLASLAESQQQLADAGRRFSSLINAVPDAVTVLASNGHIVEVNSVACEHYGRSRDELLGLSVYDLNPALPENRIEQVIVENPVGKSFVHETTNRRRDGSEFSVEVHSCVFDTEDGPRVMAVARDIHHRVIAERELRASEARYRELLQAMDKGVMVHDSSGFIESFNPSACRITGVDADDLAATLDDFSRWDLLDENANLIPHTQMPHLQALREGKTIKSTTVGVFMREKSLHIWLDVTATPLFRDGESTPFRVITTFSDISELKRDRELFRQAQALARIGGWDWNPVQGRMHWTDTLREIIGADRNEVPTLVSLLERVRVRDRRTLEIAFEDASTLGTRFEQECLIASGPSKSSWIRIIGGGRHRDGLAFRASGTLQDISAEKRAEEELKLRASSDAVTRLPNRDALLELIAEAIDQPRLDSPPSVLHVDLDRFKVVNDLVGHSEGDRLLRLAGERLLSLIAGNGRVARLGADEFLILLHAGGRSAAERIAEEIVRSFARPFGLEREEFVITSSLGIATYPHDGTTVSQLLQSANVALQEAKRRGRNCWQGFDPALAEKVSQQLLIETQLRRAMENDEFRLVYQPQVELATGRLRSVEALLRWNNRLLGDVSPQEFIPYAETTGDIVRIGSWVVRESCRQLALWRSSGTQVGRVAVNVSVRQLMNEDFDSIVGAALTEFNLPATSLEVEVTERVVIDDSPEALRTLRSLKSRGVIITIDDFGEGYSALSYLRRLPLDCLKISLTFMRGIPDNPADVAICRSIMLIAKSLGLAVVAEGVEHPSQREFLLAEGAEIAQGYLFSQPVSASEIAKFVKG